MKNTVTLFVIIAGCFINVYSQQSGTFIDIRDNRTYKWVEIGTQVWMAENLKFNAKGSRIYDGFSNNFNRYGKLYLWETAQEVCPDGWHLPGIDEWHALINSYGKIYDENGKIPYKELTKTQKEEISQRYKEAFLVFQEGGASGFNILYGGYHKDHEYSGGGTIAGFWSSDDHEKKVFIEFSVIKNTEFSVRCVKNIEETIEE